MRRIAVSGMALAVALTAAPAAAPAAKCGGNFGSWLADFKREAAAQGISQRVISQSLDGVTFNPRAVQLDRAQRVFSQSFLQFSDRMVAQYRLTKGAQLIRKYGSIFSRIEKQYGVPAPVIVGFWGLETDFGAFMGDMATLRSLATMAFDCRRPEEFRPQLIAALKIIERGDLRAGEMIGPWAGELGQTQFLPTVYFTDAVDYDGDGRRDLMKSVPDVLASTANHLKTLGWRRGEPWLQEVRAPESMPWEEANLATQHPRAQWVKWGVRAAQGSLPQDNLAASLILPMGRNGPAFLAYPNFRVYLEWNQSLVYATTAAYYATRLDGAPRVSRGRRDVETLSYNQIKSLQQALVRRGYDVGKVDGIIGEKTRAAVRDVQKKMGLPADSYPTAALLQRLR
jgi:lytic murein transglycosylase